MKDWKDNVIDFLKKNDDNYFTIEWLSYYFNKNVEEIEEFFDLAESLEIITHRDIYINKEKFWIYKYND